MRPPREADEPSALLSVDRGPGRVDPNNRASVVEARDGLKTLSQNLVLERAPDEVDAVGQERRGDGVAVVALDGAAVEREADRACDTVSDRFLETYPAGAQPTRSSEITSPEVPATVTQSTVAG
jgi:hypothetical protein